MFFFNLGLNTPIKKDGVIGIFDLDNATVKKASRDFLNKRENEKKIEYVGNDLPRSFVLYKLQNDEKEKIFITSLSPQVLEKRFKSDK